MAPSAAHLLTVAFFALSARAAEAGYSVDPPPYTKPGSPPNPGPGNGMFPPGFPFNIPPYTPPGLPPIPTLPPVATLPPVTTSTAGGLFTTLPPGGPGGNPGGPGGPIIDPNCPRTVISYTVVTHISTTVISYTNTISSLSTVTNSLCAPIIPTLPPVLISETAGGVFTTPNLPGDPLTTIPITTLITLKTTVFPTLPSIPGLPIPTGPGPVIPTGPIPTGPIIPTGPVIPTGPIPTLPTIPGGVGPSSNPSVPPPFSTYPPTPPSYPVYPPTYGNGRV